MSQPRSPRRAPAIVPDELDTTPPRGRQAWLALLVMGVLVAVIVASGLLIRHAIEPAVPAALANCTTQTQIAPHEFIGPPRPSPPGSPPWTTQLSEFQNTSPL